MKSSLLAFFLVLVCAVPVFAQLYNEKTGVIVEPFDRAASQAHEYYVNVPIPGAAEDAKEQPVRYEEATVPLNEANERHFDASTNMQTVTELEKK